LPAYALNGKDSGRLSCIVWDCGQVLFKDPLPYQVLQYTYVPDIMKLRDPYRTAHLAAAQKMVRYLLPSSAALWLDCMQSCGKLV
jgi:hypothetical protein